MIRKHLAFLLAILLTGILLTCAKKEDPGPQIWNPKITLSMGQAFVKKPGAKAGELARAGMTVSQDDMLITRMESKLEIMYNVQDLLVVGENTQVTLKKAIAKSSGSDSSVAVFLHAGKIYSRIKWLTSGKGLSYRVETPTAIAAVRGTAFSTTVDPESKATQVAVLSGKVRVMDPTGASEVTVSGGEKSRVSQDESPSQPEALPAKELPQLKSWVDQGVPAVQHRIGLPDENLPPEITSVSVTRAVAGMTVNATIMASDPENDSLSYVLQKGPQGMTIDAASGKLTWTPDQAGTFTFSVAVSDGQAKSDKVLSLKVKPPLVPSFSISPEKGGTSTRFQFDASGSRHRVLGKKGLSFAWDFDNDSKPDGPFIPDPKTSHTFTKHGKQIVRLLVKGDGDETADLKKSIFVNDPPVALIRISPKSGEKETRFKLDGSGSEDTFDPLNRLSFRWDINGDGKWDIPAKGRDPRHASASHVYDKPGRYAVILEVTDSDGATGADTAYVRVSAGVNVDPGKDATIPVNTSLAFNGKAEAKDGRIAKYEWDFEGNGSFDWTSTTSGKAEHAYGLEGEYLALLRATSSTGAVGEATVKITVINTLPKAVAKGPLTVALNTELRFEGEGKDPDNNIIKYQWDFDGDGKYDWESPATGKASYAYQRAGKYIARFKVTADDGKTDSTTVEVRVTNLAPTAMAGEDIVSKAGKKVRLRGKGKDPDGTIVKYEWDFDLDGEFDWQSTTTGETRHAFREYGFAVLRVTDADSATGVDTVRIVICPKGMKTIHQKKFCIDRFEFPNQKGKNPLANTSYFRAAAKCKEAGKRLCTADEWRFACQTREKRNFPYGFKYDKDACNTKDQTWTKKKGLAASGKFPNCATSDKVMDMSGNLMEWTSGSKKGKKSALGGSYQNDASGADCMATMSTNPKRGYFFIGFRCCK